MAVNNFTKTQGYAVTTRNSKTNKKGKKTTVYLCCTGGQKVRDSASTGQRNASSRRVGCPFLAVAKLEKGMWTLKRVSTETHNHEGGQQDSHATLRKAFMERYDFQADIRHQHEAGETPAKILSFINIKHGSGDPGDPIIGNRDISNALQIIRVEELGNKTSIQALNVNLQSNPDK